MFKKILNFFKKREDYPGSDIDEVAAQKWDEEKSKLMEKILGTEHDMVMHAIIPYAIGGGLDLYYYPHGNPGVAIATKELSELPDQGSSNADYEVYELAMFTKHPLNLDDAKNEETAFGKAHANMNSVLNVIASYSSQATLNAYETCEFPADMEGVGGKCFIFDSYNRDLSTSNFGILLIIEVFRSEMEFAREQGGNNLIIRLKETGHYPYSDLDR